MYTLINLYMVIMSRQFLNQWIPKPAAFPTRHVYSYKPTIKTNKQLLK